ncbi:MAG: UDP-2,3-diacylglucosamine diphosphatase [Deltaproteobacteria bacterium]|nr:MAG: UDP-2,3-diacylglucosamine diphosphatase [Deltaproteobacteria bacterium]
MKIVSISDVHIKTADDERAQILTSFLSSQDAKEADEIILLGDIFDLMVGNKFQYVDKYSEIFNRLEELLKSGKNIHYFEGNHDFHVKNLFNQWAVKIGQESKFSFHKKAMVRQIGETTVLFTHGDDIEIENPSYKIYKALINNKALELLGDYIVPFSAIEWIGHRASKKSRERNKQRYERSEELSTAIRDKFRESARRAKKKYSVDMVVCGHSHVLDHFREEELVYLNSGYAPLEKSYIVIQEGAEPQIKKII